MHERRVLGCFGAREDAAPDGELSGRLPFFCVPAGEDAQRRGILLRSTQQVVEGFGSRAQRTADVGSSDASGAELREVLEREVVHALGLAQIAAARAKPTEADVRLLAGRIETESLGIPSEREVVLVCRLVGVREVHQIRGARRKRGRGDAERKRASSEAAEEESSGKPAGRAPHVARIALSSSSMEPFPEKKVWSRLASASAVRPGGERAEPVAVSTLTSIVSPATVASPFTGIRACILVIELVERMALAGGHRGADDLADHVYASLGFIVLGDIATLRDQDGDEITIVVPRVRVEPAVRARGGTPLVRAPAEVVPLLRRATGRGVVCYRELTLGTGDAVRLKAVVEPTSRVASDGYRSSTRGTYVARDDLAPVVLEEVLEAPPW